VRNATANAAGRIGQNRQIDNFPDRPNLRSTDPRIGGWGMLRRVLWTYLAAGVAGAVALMVWYWPGSFFDSTTSSVWLALAHDFAHGRFYRPVVSDAGYGGTRYMPLLFAAYGGLLRTGVDSILAGIVLMQASVMALAGVLYRVLRLLGLPFELAAPLAGSVFCTAAFQSYCTDIRPDYLAAAASIGAVGLALAGSRGARARYVAAAGAACIAAGLTKATSCLTFAPIAAWLLIVHGRKAALSFTAGVIAALVAVFTIVNAASAGHFLDNVRATATGGMTASDVRSVPGAFVSRIVADPFVLIPALLGFVSFGSDVRRRLTSLPHLHFAAAVAVTFAIFASPGTVSNHLVEVHAAAVLVVGAALCQGHLSPRLVVPAYALLSVMAAAIAIPLPGLPSVHRTLSRQGVHGGRPRSAIARIHQEFLQGGVRYLSLDPIVPLLNDERPLLLDPFAADVFLRTGHPAGTHLRARIAQHDFDVVILREDQLMPRDSSGGPLFAPRRFLAGRDSGLIRTLMAGYEIRAVRRPFLILRPRNLEFGIWNSEADRNSEFTNSEIQIPALPESSWGAAQPLCPSCPLWWPRRVGGTHAKAVSVRIPDSEFRRPAPAAAAPGGREFPAAAARAHIAPSRPHTRETPDRATASGSGEHAARATAPDGRFRTRRRRRSFREGRWRDAREDDPVPPGRWMKRRQAAAAVRQVHPSWTATGRVLAGSRAAVQQAWCQGVFLNASRLARSRPARHPRPARMAAWHGLYHTHPMRALVWTPARICVVLLTLAVTAPAQDPVVVNGRPVLMIANDKLTLGVRIEGGAMVRLVLNDDQAAVNPLHEELGHFVCVDGFGPVSPEERTAGLPGHGEAHRVTWERVSFERTGGSTTTVSFSATLPLVQEIFRRTIRMADGEQVVYIESELESLLAFDRPINWAEHATIGSPFLEPGKTVIEMSATRAMTRPHESQSATPPHRLASSSAFAWPMAPGLNGEPIDVRPTPTQSPIGDHTTSLMDPARRLVFVTAFNAGRHLLLGYVFRRAEYPWTQLWESYPDRDRIARGLEFATQPFDVPRRDVIQTNSMFDTATYRWLPARSTIGSAFLMFYTRTPAEFRKVDDVLLDSGKLTIEDRASGIKVVLAASRPL
jgi:hypothetical protein